MAPAMVKSKYKTASKKSTVDETLFGKSKPAKPGGVGADFVTLSASELSAIRQRSVILTRADEEAARSQKDAEKEARNKVSNERKARMIAKEEDAKKHQQPTETEVLKAEVNADTLQKAKYMLDEELDDVKRMNQMTLYSKCVTIRDAQIEEKKVLKAEQEEENRRLDLMMEIERLKAMENYEQREVKRAEDRRQGAEILKRQITERAKERVKEEERRELERQQLQAEMERLKMEEEATLLAKKEQGRRLLSEVMTANAEQIERKKRMVEAEKEEDDRIALYIKMKERKEQEIANEADRVKRENELNVAMLRAKQEKARDSQAELDELRAQRAQEAYERDWRRQEKANAERAARMNAELASAREQQRNMKMVALSEIAEQEHMEHRRIIAAQRAREAEELEAASAAAAVRRRHKDEILMQIKSNEEAKKKSNEEYIKEGELMRAQHRAELNKLETIKNRKLEELEHAGVPGKYRAELARKRIG